MKVSATRRHDAAHARLTNQNLLAFILETVGIAFLACVPVIWGLMPLILRFDPEPYAVTLGVVGPILFTIGLLIRPRVLRPDFVNSIMQD
jgi:hypothetical protein